MNTKVLPLLVALLSISAFAFVIAPGVNDYHSFQGIQPDSLPSVVFTGNITILPDGQVSVVGHGSTSSPLSKSGDFYNLTGNVNGTLNIEKNGSNVNGNGFYLYNNSYSMGPIINVSQVNNVSVSNMHISSSTTGAIEVSNASHISLNDLNISTAFVGVMVFSNTEYINVSNSIVDLLLPNSGLNNLFDIGMGITPGGLFIPQPSQQSSHNSIYNDTLFAQDAIVGGVMIGSNYTSLIDTTITSTTPSFGNVFDGANNTLIEGLNLNSSAAQTAVVVAPASVGTITNNTFVENSVTIWNTTSGTGAMGAVVFNSTGTVSGNKILVNNAGGDSTGLIAQGKNITVSNNDITLMHDSQAYDSTGIQTQGTNLDLTGNNLNLSGKNVSGILELSVGTTFSQLTGNSIYINGTDFSNGILLNGSSQNVNNNSIFMYTGSGNLGISGYAQAPSNFSDLSVSGNLIVIKHGSPVGISLNASTTIQKEHIENNVVEFNQTNIGLGIYLSSLNNSIISMNTFNNSPYSTSEGFYVYNAGNSTIYKNNISNGGLSDGYELSGSNNITFSQNFVNGFAGSFYFANTVNSTIYGNTGNGSIDSIYVTGSDNLTIYHNNFENYTSSPLITSSKNIVFNLTYPIGGNYWDIATTDQFSGPNQNVPGSDGINDTSFTVVPGYIDYYPLVKPWTNPQAVFNETGILPGSSWSVTFNGQTKVSSGSSIVFNIVNGTYQNYSYAIHAVSGYKGGGQSGIFSYTGNNSFASSTIYIPKYVFNISETGLPTGTSWNVSINGTLHTITSSSYSVVAINGTSFTYKAYNNTLYYASPVSGSATLAGKNITVNVVYTHWAYIVADFNQTGINLTINGKAVGTDVHSFNETVPVGTYNVVISGNGYVTKYDNFTLKAGQNMNISTTLVQVKGSPSPLSGPYLYVVVGVVAAAVVISGAYFILRRKS